MMNSILLSFQLTFLNVYPGIFNRKRNPVLIKARHYGLGLLNVNPEAVITSLNTFFFDGFVKKCRQNWV